MRIDVEIEEDHLACDPDLEKFVAEAKSLGIPLEIGEIRTKSQTPGYGLIGPESEIIIKIDPESVRMLFEYAATSITLYKGSSFVSSFFKKAVEKVGENAGSKIASTISRLWLNLYKRIRASATRPRQPKMALRLELLIEGIPVDATMRIDPSRFNEVSEHDEEQALSLLFHKVLPLLPEMISRARAAGTNPESVYVTLALPESNLESRAPAEVAWRRGAWHWHVFISPEHEFIIDRRGRRRDRTGSGSKRWWQFWS